MNNYLEDTILNLFKKNNELHENNNRNIELIYKILQTDGEILLIFKKDIQILSFWLLNLTIYSILLTITLVYFFIKNHGL